MSVFDAAPDIVTGVRDCFAGAAAVLAPPTTPTPARSRRSRSRSRAQRAAARGHRAKCSRAGSPPRRCGSPGPASIRRRPAHSHRVHQPARGRVRARPSRARTTEALDAAGAAAVTLVETALGAAAADPGRAARPRVCQTPSRHAKDCVHRGTRTGRHGSVPSVRRAGGGSEHQRGRHGLGVRFGRARHVHDARPRVLLRRAWCGRRTCSRC